MRPLPRAEGFYAGLVGVLATLVIAAHLAGATFLTRTLWGSHFYRFLPVASLIAALVVTMVLVLVAIRLPASAVSSPAKRPAWTWAALWTLVVALSAGLFWWLRIRHTLLGDSGPLSHNLPLGESSHPRQPLSLFLHHHAYQWTRSLFEGPGRDAQDVARDTVALDGVVAGALFVPVAYLLARHLVARPPGAPADVAPAADRVTPVLAAALLLTQGYMQLFFGYVENYTWFTLAIGLYLWAGMSFVAGRAPLILAALALAAAIGFNISGIGLLPSLLALGVWGLARSDRRAATARGLVGSVLVFIALQVSLAALGGFNAREGFRYMWDLVVRGEATDRSALYLLSWPHVREFLAVQLLIGPFAGFFMLPAAFQRLATPGPKDARLLFLLAAALPTFVAAWMYGDSIQGIPRDWDLFAPFALPFTAAGIHCLATAAIRPVAVRRLLAVATAVSIFHSGAWIALNTSENRSLARYMNLPASKGRTEMVVGYWYLTHGRKQEARDWFERSVAAYPGNNLAHHQLGLYAMDERRYLDAVRHFRVAVEARPDKSNYRLALVDALVYSGRPGEALPELERLIATEPRRAPLWGCYGIVLSGLKRTDEARAAFERAALLAPGDPRYPRLIARLGQRDAYALAVTEDWESLVLE